MTDRTAEHPAATNQPPVDDAGPADGAPSPAEEPPSSAEPPHTNGAAEAALYLWRAARKLVVLVVGSTVLLAGVIMLVTPGPAVVVIPAGLAILATEFVWARRLLHRVKRKVQVAMQQASGRRNPTDAGSDAKPSEATDAPPSGRPQDEPVSSQEVESRRTSSGPA